MAVMFSALRACQPSFASQKDSWFSFLLETVVDLSAKVWLKGLGQLKNTVTSKLHGLSP
jgi:hypothetical protein